MENMQILRCIKKYIHIDIVEKFYAFKETVKQNQRNDIHTTQAEALKAS
jgi:hypothetical protein